jgi:hypothetical protein
LLAITLQRAITANLPGVHGGIQTVATLSERQRAQTTPALAHAFGTAFWVAFALAAASILPALLLPRVRASEDAETALREAA